MGPRSALMAAIVSKQVQKTARVSETKTDCELSEDKEIIGAKYKKMLKIGLPQQSVINKMRQDGISKQIISAVFPTAIESKKFIRKIQKRDSEKLKLPPGLKPKKLIKPKNKMRNIHWTTVNPFDVEKTIWNEIDDENIICNVDELEAKFCWKQIQRKQPVNIVAKPQKNVIRILDSRRAYNVEIFLGKLKMDVWKIRHAIEFLNESELCFETIQNLIHFVPTPAEAELFNGYENTENLGVAENFFQIIRDVDNNLLERMSLWVFSIEFDELLEEENMRLKYLKESYNAIKSSESLKLMFTIILSIGNYINGGTKNGEAYGFKLSSLSHLMRSKTVDNKQTMMEYIYCFVARSEKYKSVIRFVNELQCLEKASNIDVAILRKNIFDIGHKLNLIKRRNDNFEKIGLVSDTFCLKMKPFYLSSIGKFKELERLMDSVFNDLKSLGIWLNEPKDVNFKYLKTLNQFRNNFVLSKTKMDVEMMMTKYICN
eukprot:63181_1